MKNKIFENDVENNNAVKVKNPNNHVKFENIIKDDNIECIIIETKQTEDDINDVLNNKLEEAIKEQRMFSNFTSDKVSSPRKTDRSSKKGSHREDSLINEARLEMNSSFSDSENKTKYFNNNCSDSETSTIEICKRKIDIGNQYRQKANLLFKKNKFKDALNEYLNALNELNSLLSVKRELLNMTNINWIRMECFNGIAVCYLLLKDFNKALEYTNEVLNINSNNSIALSYKAKSLFELDRLKEAAEVTKLALSIKYSKSLMKLLKAIEDKIKTKRIDERKKVDDPLNIPNSPIRSVNNPNKVQESTGFTSSMNNQNEKKTGNKLIDKNQNNKIKKTANHILLTIYKFLKIILINSYNFIRKHKLIMLILSIIWVITFRKRLKNRLYGMLKIKLN